MRHPVRPFLLCILLGFWLTAGCSSQPEEPQVFGSAYVLGSLRQAASASSVTAVRLTISAPDMTDRKVNLLQSGGQWGGLIGQLPAGTNRTFAAEAVNASGTVLFAGQVTGVTITADQTISVNLTLQDVNPPPPFENSAPVIASITANPAATEPGGSVSLVAAASDSDVGDSLTIAWRASSGTLSSSTSLATTWTAPQQTGPATLTLTVTDSKGASAAFSLVLTVRSGSGSADVLVSLNAWPLVSQVLATPTALSAGESTTVTASAADSDGDILTYQWTAGCAGTWENKTSATARFTPSIQPAGTSCVPCALSVAVSDGRGGGNTGTLSVCVGPPPATRLPPEVTETFQSSSRATPGQVVSFSVAAHDSQGDALSFAWISNVGSLGTAQSPTPTSSSITWTAASCVPSNTTATITVQVTSASGMSTSKSFTVTGLPNCCVSGSRTFNTAGQTAFTVPEGCSRVSFEMAGAGGGNGYGSSGGAGGLARLTFDVAPGSLFNLTIGSPGAGYSTQSEPPGGQPGGGASGGYWAGGGGGYTALMSGSTILAIAGGGGGGGDGGNGGNGGGPLGNDGSPASQGAGGGQGGTQTQGGTGGVGYNGGTHGQAGDYLRGGQGSTSADQGGGGGGGYYGGGGGGGEPDPAYAQAGGGGGGSSFISSSIPQLISSSTVAGGGSKQLTTGFIKVTW